MNFLQNIKIKNLSFSNKNWNKKLKSGKIRRKPEKSRKIQKNPKIPNNPHKKSFIF